jgi:putative ATPase
MAKATPLSIILRPKVLTEVLGQQHLLGPDKPLAKMVQKGRLQSMILWGPPGTGKTSIARALAAQLSAAFHQLNATEATVKDLRAVVKTAQSSEGATIVFVDEIHRWSKSQQDVMLPVVEDGTVVLIGATTEKPKFAVNSTIISRCVVFEVKPLDTQAMIDLIKRVKAHYRTAGVTIQVDNDAAKRLITQCSGDARKAVTVLETVLEILSDDHHVTLDHINVAIPDKHLVFDASGNDHYDLAHCYQEAIQNSDTNGALYWLGKWLASGEDPAYICRRMLVTAAEDCAGNPNAWLAALLAVETTERVGMPECMIPMSLATCEMGESERNKSAYKAIKEVMNDIETKQVVHVPPGLRAGTHGYVQAVKKVYLKNWVKDKESSQVLEKYCADAGLIPRPSREEDESIVYAIGYYNDDGVGMAYGPSLNLQEMLDIVPGEDAKLFKFERGKEDQIVFYWRDGKWNHS